VESLRVLLQAHQLFSHYKAEQSIQQSDIDSTIYCLLPAYPSTNKDRDNSCYMRLHSLKL
jgi:hypothetical protein